MVKGVYYIILVFTIGLPLPANCQTEPLLFELGQMSRFDSLLNVYDSDWTLSKIGNGANDKLLKKLGSVYSLGVTWELSRYHNGKYFNTVDRWFIVDVTRCLVYEQYKSEWGGVFGYVNGVRVNYTDKDFKALLDKEIGTPLEFED